MVYKMLQPRHIIAITCQGNKMYVDGRDNNIVPDLLYKEVYEPFETELLKKELRKGNVVLDIGAHILSRIPGNKAKSYKEIPLLLAERKIFPEEFAVEKLIKMAGYRNRMTHFYYRISPEEILKIIKTHLNDFTEFSTHIKKILKHPKKYGFPED